MRTATTKPTEFGRARPFAGLVLTLGFLALHHAYAARQGEIYPSLVLFLFLVSGLAAAGCVHPPVFFALTKYGQHLPMRYKVMGAVCALAGCALGLYVLITIY